MFTLSCNILICSVLLVYVDIGSTYTNILSTLLSTLVYTWLICCITVGYFFSVGV